MPNWTSNTLTIEGKREVLRQLLNERCTNGQLDFEKIVPKPEGFDENLPSGSGDEAYDLYFGSDVAWRAKQYPWVIEAGGVDRDSTIAVFAKRYEESKHDAELRTKYPTYKALAEAYKRNVDLSGAKTWYEWNYANWGTKWGACDCNEVTLDADGPMDDVIEFTFNTAWCEPEPIFEALHEQYPTLFIKYVAEHENDDTVTGKRYFPEEDD